MKWSPLQLPIWALLLAICIAAAFLIPIGIVAAVSNTVGISTDALLSESILEAHVLFALGILRSSA